MNRLRVFSVAVLVAGALACAAFALAQTQSSEPKVRQMAVEPLRDSRVIGVDIVREINTAEVEHSALHGAFASWDQLYRSPDEQKRWQRLQLSSGPEVIPGWTLALVASADGKSFELSLRSLADRCGFSFFSDQSGVIYEGHAIGCPGEVLPTKQ
jgi:hypothetical protein